jgi:hypothetical protein
MNFRSTMVVLFFCILAARVHGETNEVRRIPPPGIAIPDSDRAELERGAAELKNKIESLRA